MTHCKGKKSRDISINQQTLVKKQGTASTRKATAPANKAINIPDLETVPTP